MKTKALISCMVTIQLICVFVFAYTRVRFSHGTAHTQVNDIMLTSLCYLNCLKPHFHKVKLGFTGYTLLSFDIHAQNTYCGYFLILPHCLCFAQNKKNPPVFHLKIVIFTSLKIPYLNITHIILPMGRTRKFSLEYGVLWLYWMTKSFVVRFMSLDVTMTSNS